MLAKLFPTYGYDAEVKQYFIDGKLSGEYGSLPAGAINVATGFEVRREEVQITPTGGLERGDIDGVGELMEIAATRGRRTRPKMKMGICGEHGGDPASIAFCERTGLDYVSASPFRVPIARLSAAQAAIKARSA